jgi:integrase
MDKRKGERVETGIWHRRKGKGYIAEANVRDPVSGARIRKSKKFPNLALAREWRVSVKTDAIRGEIRKERTRQITFAAFAEEYLKVWAPTRRPTTVNSETVRVRNVLIPNLGKRSLSAITPHSLEVYLANRRNGLVGGKKPKPLSQASVNRELCRIKHMFGKAVEWGYLEKNPAERIKQQREYPRAADYLSRDEIRAVTAACEGVLKTILTVAIHTGLRRGELLSLSWQDIDLERRVLTVRDSKNHETRYVPLCQEATDALGEHRLWQTREVGGIASHVFVNPRSGEPYQNLRRGFATVLKRAGITRHFTFHGLRHTAASQMVMAGLPLQTVGAILGHRTAQMTLRYAHLSPGYLRDAVDRLGEHLTGRDSDGDFMETRPKTGTDDHEGRP